MMNHAIEKYPGELENLRNVYHAAVAIKPQLCKGNAVYPKDQELIDAITAVETRQDEHLKDMLKRMSKEHGQ